MDVAQAQALPIRRTSVGRSVGSIVLVLPALVFLAFFYLVPLVRLIVSSFGAESGPLGYYIDIVSTPSYRGSLTTTLTLAFSVTVLCVVLGIPTAYAISSLSGRIKAVLLVLIILPYFVSTLVRTYAWMVLLATNGPANQFLITTGIFEDGQRLIFTRGAVLIAMTAVLLPMMILPIYSVMQRIDPAVLRAASSLGANSIAAFWKAYFPQVMPGVLAGVLLVFVFALGFFITPALLGGPGDRVVAMDIAAQARLLTSAGLIEAQAVVVLAMTLVVLAIASRVVRFDLIWGSLVAPAAATATGAGPEVARRRLGLGGIRRAGADRIAWPLAQRLGVVPNGFGIGMSRLIAAGVIVVTTLPLVIALIISFSSVSFLTFPPPGFSLQWYQAFFSDASWIRAVTTSLLLGVLTVVVSLVLGTLAALGLTRGSYPGKGLVIAFVLSPLIVPHIVIGLSLLWLFLRIDLTGTTHGVVATHALASIPLVTIIVAASLQLFDRRLEQAAQSLGASRLRVFWHVTVPQIRPGLLAAAFFAFLLSFDELVFTLFVKGATMTTLPVKLWSDLNFQLRPILSVVSVIEILVVVAGLAAAAAVIGVRGAAKGGDTPRP